MQSSEVHSLAISEGWIETDQEGKSCVLYIQLNAGKKCLAVQKTLRLLPGGADLIRRILGSASCIKHTNCSRVSNHIRHRIGTREKTPLSAGSIHNKLGNRPLERKDMEKHMDTTDIKIHVSAPPQETQQAIERDFMKQATSAGAINAYILKKNGHWTLIAEFVDAREAAFYAAHLTKVAGVTLGRVDLKPESNAVAN
jgi:hypothetical protein